MAQRAYQWLPLDEQEPTRQAASGVFVAVHRLREPFVYEHGSIVRVQPHPDLFGYSTALLQICVVMEAIRECERVDRGLLFEIYTRLPCRGRDLLAMLANSGLEIPANIKILQYTP